jgi:hypothetical protein
MEERNLGGPGRGSAGELHMLLLILSTACAGLFCGAALYVNLVAHPARMACGPELAQREFAPSYQRATILQVHSASPFCKSPLRPAVSLSV